MPLKQTHLSPRNYSTSVSPLCRTQSGLWSPTNIVLCHTGGFISLRAARATGAAGAQELCEEPSGGCRGQSGAERQPHSSAPTAPRVPPPWVQTVRTLPRIPNSCRLRAARVSLTYQAGSVLKCAAPQGTLPAALKWLQETAWHCLQRAGSQLMHCSELKVTLHGGSNAVRVSPTTAGKEPKMLSTSY